MHLNKKKAQIFILFCQSWRVSSFLYGSTFWLSPLRQSEFLWASTIGIDPICAVEHRTISAWAFWLSFESSSTQIWIFNLEKFNQPNKRQLNYVKWKLQGLVFFEKLSHKIRRQFRQLLSKQMFNKQKKNNSFTSDCVQCSLEYFYLSTAAQLSQLYHWWNWNATVSRADCPSIWCTPRHTFVCGPHRTCPACRPTACSPPWSSRSSSQCTTCIASPGSPRTPSAPSHLCQPCHHYFKFSAN